MPVHAVGKINDLFAGVGISAAHAGATNEQALASVDELMERMDNGMLFVNLIETDQVYGHRKDVDGFHGALQEIDAHLGKLLSHLRAEDLLIVTADHGVDPAHPGTDHTREYAPLLAITGEMQMRSAAGGVRGGGRHDGPLADVGASVLWHLRGADGRAPGQPLRGVSRDARAARGRDDQVASSRRWSRAGAFERVEILDPRWSRPLAPDELADALQGRARQAPRAGAESTCCGSSRGTCGSPSTCG